MAENVEVAVVISLISHSIPKIQCTSGLQSAILNSGSYLTSENVGAVIRNVGVVKNGLQLAEFAYYRWFPS